VHEFRYWADINQEIQRQEGLKRVFIVNSISIFIEFMRRNFGLLFVGFRLTAKGRTRLNTGVPRHIGTKELGSIRANEITLGTSRKSCPKILCYSVFTKTIYLKKNGVRKFILQNGSRGLNVPYSVSL
jgi:hypothetical protein